VQPVRRGRLILKERPTLPDRGEGNWRATCGGQLSKKAHENCTTKTKKALARATNERITKWASKQSQLQSKPTPQLAPVKPLFSRSHGWSRFGLQVSA